MKQYTERITEEIMVEKGIESIKLIQLDELNPRMIIKFRNEETHTIDGVDEIIQYVDNLIKPE